MKSPVRILRDYLPHRMRSAIAETRGRGLLSGYHSRLGCFFVHIPRTGGTSVAKALFADRSSHAPWHFYQRQFPLEFAALFKFCVARNPWDRLVSTYFYLKQGGMDRSDQIWARENIAHFPTFGDFVREWLDEGNIWTWVHFLPQYYFVADRSGRLMVDFAARFEHLAQDFEIICDEIGLRSELPQLNRSEHRTFTLSYDEETAEIAVEIYARDIELFGYRFDNGD